MTSASPGQSTGKTNVDLLTLAAIGTVAFIIQNVLHEGVGHGGACIIVGGDPTALSTSYFDCDYEGVSTAGRKFVAAAGSFLNVLTGFVFLLVLRKLKDASSGTRLFLWLSGALGLLTGTGYLLFSGAIGVGDWAVIIDGFRPVWLWRTSLTLAGFVLYLACIAFLLAELAPLLDTSRDDWVKVAFLVTFIPYIVGSATSTIGAFLNPISPVLIFTSAAAAFGGASGLAWMTQMYKTGPCGRLIAPQHTAPSIPRSWTWVGLAVIMLVVHILLLGPSVQL